MMLVHTDSQKMAQTAHHRIAHGTPDRDFRSFARSFPSLVHSCGLAQAIAFANAKGHDRYLADLAAVLSAIGHSEAASVDNLQRATREHSISAYIRLSRSALQAASWLKRYVEAEEQE